MGFQPTDHCLRVALDSVLGVGISAASPGNGIFCDLPAPPPSSLPRSLPQSSVSRMAEAVKTETPKKGFGAQKQSGAVDLQAAMMPKVATRSLLAHSARSRPLARPNCSMPTVGRTDGGRRMGKGKGRREGASSPLVSLSFAHFCQICLAR